MLNEDCLIVTKSDTKEFASYYSLGHLIASLASSRKEFMSFSDPFNTRKATLKLVAIPLSELEELDKTNKPKYWNFLQLLKETRGAEKLTKYIDSPDYSVYSVGMSPTLDLDRVANFRKENLLDDSFREDVADNGFYTFTKKM